MSLEFRKPSLKDIPQMQEIVRGYVEKNIILYRSNDEIANMIRSYTLAFKDENLAGFAALHIFSSSLAEVRMLVVKEEFQGMQIGKKIVQELLKEAQNLGLKRVLALTYQEDFFKKLGFKLVQKAQIPEHKVWEDCIKCKRFPQCDELALIIDL